MYFGKRINRLVKCSPDSMMKTYLNVTFSSEGAKPSEIIMRLRSLGFRPIMGEHDMVYEWGNNATEEDSLWFADKIHATLEGFKVLFHIETVSDGI
jgi:hypothetical protein